jgi:ribokinase
MPKVVVAGRIDVDAVINVHRHPKPGEEIGGRDLRYLPGGKGANQAVAAARAGGRVALFGCVGDDSLGNDMIAFLNTESIDTRHVAAAANFRTGMAFIVVDDLGQNTIVYDATDVPPFVFDSPASIEADDILVSQFDIPEPSILEFLRAGRQRGARNIFNAAPAQPISAELLALVDVLVLNEFEFAHVLGRGCVDPADRGAVETAVASFRPFGNQALVVTLGAHGVLLRTEKHTMWINASDDEPVDTTGAGDAFTGALAAELCDGASLEEAAAYACASAGLSVTRYGASVAMPYRREVLNRCAAGQR